MLGLYLFALILGGGLLLFSVLGGGDHGGAGDPADVGGHDAGHHGGHDAGHHGGAGEIILGFFRPRNLTFFLATFGVTGTLLTLLGAARPASLGLSVGMGIGAMAVAHAVFTWLRRSDSAVDVVSDADLEGSLGRVTLPIGPGERGRVACLIGGREVYLVARLADQNAGRLERGREVVILRTGDGVAEVAPLGGALPPAPE